VSPSSAGARALPRGGLRMRRRAKADDTAGWPRRRPSWRRLRRLPRASHGVAHEARWPSHWPWWCVMRRGHFNPAQRRDRRGRWTSGAGSAGAAAAGAAIGGALGSKAARRRIVPGSIKNESFIGTSADGKFHGAKLGAVYTAPGGREILAKGILGVSRKPTAKNKVHASPGKSGANVTVKPAQAKRTKSRGKPTAGKMHTQSAGSKVPTGTTRRKKRAGPARASSAGRKVRRKRGFRARGETSGSGRSTTSQRLRAGALARPPARLQGIHTLDLSRVP